MTEPDKVRRRSRQRNKESADIKSGIAASLAGATLWPDTAAVEIGEFHEKQVIVVDNALVGLIEDGRPFLTVRGLLAFKPQARYVTVDMGAVKFVTNGADVMAPGIVEADPDLQPGDWCWIRDERNKQPLAVGKVLVPAGTMVRGKGKAVKSVHHLGDKIWNAEV